MQLVKKQIPADIYVTESNLKTLIQLLDANWRYDVSNHASDDLSQKKWNKLTIVPLASDIKILKDYLHNVSNNIRCLIETGNNNFKLYTDLLEVVYCKILLLNRRRPGELQRIRLHDYLTSIDHEEGQYEEFNRALNPAERVLIKSFKRIVIKGKRNRGVPVLLSLDVQKDMDVLLSLRDKYVSKTNPYLFGKPGYETPLYGYKILQKMAKLSGAKYPNSISSTKLRKHLATICQIFSMSENDLEQLASFMGHTPGIHKNSYRLPDDVYQTAKISKLLLLMENGKADKFKGKSIDEIDLDLEEEIVGEEIENSDILNADVEVVQNISSVQPEITPQIVNDTQEVAKNVKN